MIEITHDYILYDGEINSKGVGFLWDCLQIVGKRIVGVIVNFNRKKFDYSGDYELSRKGNVGVGMFNIDTYDDFEKFIIISQDSNTDYYIIVNHSFEEVSSRMKSGRYVLGEGFDNDMFIREFRRSFYAYANKLFIDLEEFKDYDFQLKRVAKRYMKKK